MLFGGVVSRVNAYCRFRVVLPTFAWRCSGGGFAFFQRTMSDGKATAVGGEKVSSKADKRQEEIVSLYRSICAEPMPTWGHMRLFGGDLLVASKWQFGDMDAEKKITVKITHLVKIPEDPQQSLGPLECVGPAEAVNESIISLTPSSTNQTLSAIHRSVTKGDKKSEFVEIWNSFRPLFIYDVETKGLHGNIIMKGHLGSTDWSTDEQKYLFVAEKKLPKGESFFCKKPAPDSEQGTKFRWDEDWGEQVEGVTTPVVVILERPDPDGDDNELKVTVIEKEDVSLGQAVFTPDGKGVVFVGISNKPYRLGTVFCLNRLQTLYHYDLESKVFTEIGDANKYIYSPRFTATGKHLLYLQNGIGGPHNMTSELIRMEWPSKVKQVIVPVPANPQPNEFPGLYTQGLARRCTSPDGSKAYVNTQWHSFTHILEIDLDTKKVANITEPSAVGIKTPSLLSWSLLCVESHYILAAASSITEKPSLALGRRDPASGKITWSCRVADGKETSNTTIMKSKVGFTEQCVSPEKPDAFEVEVLKLTPAENPDQYFEAIYAYPKAGKHNLIVLPHGGPHAAYAVTYLPAVELFLRAGYGVLIVNYRGSTGFGEKNLRALPGHIGDIDVKDVHMAVAQAKLRGHVAECVLMGGSHGGFVAAHLIGQYPSDYSAACLYNPVIDMSLQGPSDIPDWYWYEGGCKGEFSFDSLPTDEDLIKLRACSPIAHAHKITAPCFFFLGSLDRRVDKGQGLRLYKYLKARGVEARCNMYSDNHSLASELSHSGDEKVNTLLWLDRYCKRDLRN